MVLRNVQNISMQLAIDSGQPPYYIELVFSRKHHPTLPDVQLHVGENHTLNQTDHLVSISRLILLGLTTSIQ